jgi:ABC-type cobalamin/Fe3+-siderophores transport system ATPase subunit
VVNKNIKQIGLSTMYNVKVVGMYGVGGIGKSTVCKTLCNELSHEYEGRVCHFEFEITNLSSKGLLEKVLMRLTNTSLEFLQRMNEGEVGVQSSKVVIKFLCGMGGNS